VYGPVPIIKVRREALKEGVIGKVFILFLLGETSQVLLILTLQ